MTVGKAELLEKLTTLMVWPRAVADQYSADITVRKVRMLYEASEAGYAAAVQIEADGLALGERDATINRYRQALEQIASLDYDYAGPDDAGFEAMIHDIARSALA